MISLWEYADTAADLTSLMCIVGSEFAALSRYAVNFWNQGLHQGASLSLDKEEHTSDVFWQPLVVTIAGLGLSFVALALLRTQSEIMCRRTQALLVRGRTL
jgi:heme exporter protein C